MPAHSIKLEHIPWHTEGGARPLGRHVEHDSRSLNYLFRSPRHVTIQSVRHQEFSPVIDQGQLGSCTGNAAESAAGCDPVFSVIPDSVTAKPGSDAGADEQQAIALYHAATVLDGFRGTYPPDDTGSTGLAAAKAMQQAGLISGYQHATDINTMVSALMVAPVMIGINWYSSFDTPAADGTIALAKRAHVRGGHELCVIGYESASNNGSVNSADMLTIKNSWSTGWGALGYCRLSVKDMDTLLGQQGDATIPVPLGDSPTPDPDPTPTPTPTPDDVDKAMWNACQVWAKAKGLA